MGENYSLATPWARFWSRNLDFNLYVIPISIYLAIFHPGIFVLPDGNMASEYAINFFLLPVCLIVDVFVLSLFGNTIGRKLVGIRVQMSDGGKVDLITGLSRNFRIYFFGYALGFPIVNIFTMGSQYSNLKKGYLVSWDEDLGTRVVSRSSGLHRTIICAILVIFIVSFSSVI